MVTMVHLVPGMKPVETIDSKPTSVRAASLRSQRPVDQAESAV
jgi:hypothetical protein